MKIITITEFIEIIKPIEVTSGFEATETCLPESDDEDQPAMTWGWVWNTIATDVFEINYQNTYEHPEGKPSLATSSDDVPELW